MIYGISVDEWGRMSPEEQAERFAVWSSTEPEWLCRDGNFVDFMVSLDRTPRSRASLKVINLLAAPTIESLVGILLEFEDYAAQVYEYALEVYKDEKGM